jgi:hypothetical protein
VRRPSFQRKQPGAGRWLATMDDRRQPVWKMRSALSVIISLGWWARPQSTTSVQRSFVGAHHCRSAAESPSGRFRSSRSNPSRAPGSSMRPIGTGRPARRGCRSAASEAGFSRSRRWPGPHGGPCRWSASAWQHFVITRSGRPAIDSWPVRSGWIRATSSPATSGRSSRTSFGDPLEVGRDAINAAADSRNRGR